MQLTIDAFLDIDTPKAIKVEPLEELIDNLCDEIKYRQIERIRGGVYSRQNSFVFNDLLTNYERISDHCSNIAIAMIELKQDEFDLHNYVESLKQHKNELFDQYFDEYRLKYSL